MFASAAAAVSRWVLPVLTVTALAAAGLPAATGHLVSGVQIRLADADNPLAGRPFYVDPISVAMVASRNNPSSPELGRIANTPASYWLDNAFPTSTVAGTVAKHTGAAAAVGAIPVLTLYAIPNRDCGSYAAGGFGSGEAYTAWIDQVSAGLGGNPAAIILEPDALAMADCLSDGQRDERYNLIRYAVDAFGRNPGATVYIDGGHSRWVPAEEMANRLNAAGVDRARGFSLNANNFFTTEEEIGYGDAISGMTGGAHFVVDTSRNGAGPADDGDPLYWCNPSGRALGVAPTTDTASPNADAYLWIKRPGESDGSCRGGAGAGAFVHDYAVELARNSG